MRIFESGDRLRKLLEEISQRDGKVPDDLCYVNNFKNTEAPILLRLKAGEDSGVRMVSANILPAAILLGIFSESLAGGGILSRNIPTASDG